MNSHQQALVDELLHHDDLRDRLSAVVERTRRLPHFNATERVSGNRVPGCSSSVWLISSISEGHCHFRSDADSPVVRGLVATVAEFFAGVTPIDVVRQPVDPLEILDLKRGLTPTRRHGLNAVLAAIRSFAQSHLPESSAPET